MIQLAEVSKEYGAWGRSRVRALHGVTLGVPSGSALGVVGPNGAGKSTLIRLLLGYLRPSAGEVSIGGMPPRGYAERHGIGYVPERVDLPPRWTVRGAMRAFAALSELPEPAERIDASLREMGIDALAERRVGTLSKGNLGRLAIAQALLAPRAVLVLDEPTDGLDPEWVARLREILVRWRAGDPDRTLVIASHNLDEVERVAERVAVLDGGRLREVLELGAATPGLPPYRLELADGDGDAALRALFPGAEADPALPGAFRVTATDLAELNRRVAALLAGGATLRALAPERTSLEQRFRRALSPDALPLMPPEAP
jgi:ABC-type multidrug transport system ATPase subunit